MKIPQYDSKVNPDNVSQISGKIMDVRDTSTLQAVADGLGEVYKVKMKEQEEAKKTAIFQADNSIKMGLKKAQYDILDKIRNGGSYATAEQEYQKAYDSIVNQFSGAFDVDESGNTKARALSEYQASGLNDMLQIRDAVTSRRRADTLDSSKNMVGLLVKEYSFAKTQEQKSAIASKISDNIASLSGTGIRSPDEGKLKLREVLGNAEVDRIKVMMSNGENPYNILADVEMGKETIGPDAYVQLKGILADDINKKISTEKVGLSLMGGSATPNFDVAVSSVFKEEGGYVANDAGKGPTIYGVNSSANKEEFAKIMALKNQGLDDQALALAKDTYKKKYWDAIGGDSLPPDLAYAAFDAAVNMGQPTAKKLLEQSNGDINEFQRLRKEEYVAIANSNPEKAKNLSAWLSRTDRITAQLVGGAQAAKQEDVDKYFSTNIAQLSQTNPAQYESSIVNVSKSTGYVPNAIVNQAQSFFNKDPNLMSKSDEAAISSLATIVTQINREAVNLKSGELPSDLVAKANILRSRIDAGISPKDAMMSMSISMSSEETKKMFNDSKVEAQKLLLDKTVNGYKADEKLPSYANSEFIYSYATHRTVAGGSSEEAYTAAKDEIMSKYKKFNGKMFKDPVTKYSRFSEESWLKLANTSLATAGIKTPEGATLGIIANKQTMKDRMKFTNPADEEKIGYQLVWYWDDKHQPVEVLDNDGNPVRIYGVPKMVEKKQNKIYSADILNGNTTF